MVSPRVWFITGTSSGFGRRLVNIVRARRDRVIATARTLASITQFLDDPRLPRANIHCAELDITAGTKQVKKQVDSIIQASGWGTVNVLVNNAGVAIPAFIEEGGTDLLRHQFKTNVFGTLDVTTAVLPYMRNRESFSAMGKMSHFSLFTTCFVVENGGTVVTMGSRSGWKTEVKGLGFYGSSKAAIHAMAETMAVELEPFGIRVLIVEPGSFRTEGIYRNAFDAPYLIPDYHDQRAPAAKEFRAPAGKQPGDPIKAMNALVEVVCGEGRAQGKAWPLYLVLGKDADQDVRNKCTRMIQYLDEWREVVRDVDLEHLD